MARQTMKTFVWVKYSDGTIKKAETKEMLSIDDSDYLYYCPVCGRRLSTNSTSKCLCCYKTVTPYRSAHQCAHYLNKLSSLMESLNEPHLSIDDIIIQEEVSKLDTFRDGLTYKKYGKYKWIYIPATKQLENKNITSQKSSSDYSKFVNYSNSTCPACGSEDTVKISENNDFISFGIFASTLNEEYKCKNCGFVFAK